MKIHNVRQGSAEWLALRRDFFTASEAPAMMGVSPYMTRAELLLMKATGLAPQEVTDDKQALFDRGHEAEAQARAILEAREDCDFYPIVASDDNLLASVDGATFDRATLFEHKLYNDALAAQIAAGELGPEYYWQLEQQLLVLGADRVIFVASDGTPEHWAEMEYRPIPGRAEQLLAAWVLFEKDLENVEATAPKVEVIGRAPDALPALRIELTGAVKASNLAEFKAVALGVIGGIKTDLTTDQDFADAEKTVKFLADVETRLKAAKEHALSQTASVYEVLTTIDGIVNAARDTRLILDKAVDKCKKAIRENIVIDAAKALNTHIDQINATLGGKVRLPPMRGNFAEAIKGKRTLESLQAAADSELARMKLEANAVGDLVRLNLQTLRELAREYPFLFHDAQSLVLRDNESVKAIIESRIAEHKARQAEIALELAAKTPEPAPLETSAAPAPAPDLGDRPRRCSTLVIENPGPLFIGQQLHGGTVVYATPGDWSHEVMRAINHELGCP